MQSTYETACGHTHGRRRKCTTAHGYAREGWGERIHGQQSSPERSALFTIHQRTARRSPVLEVLRKRQELRHSRHPVLFVCAAVRERPSVGGGGGERSCARGDRDGMKRGKEREGEETLLPATSVTEMCEHRPLHTQVRMRSRRLSLPRR